MTTPYRRNDKENNENDSWTDVGSAVARNVILYDGNGNVINPSTTSSKYATNAIDDYTTTSVTYFCKEGASTADWWFVKFDETGNFLVVTHATTLNNPTVTTYAAAYSARATTLVYGNYNTAF